MKKDFKFPIEDIFPKLSNKTLDRLADKCCDSYQKIFKKLPPDKNSECYKSWQRIWDAFDEENYKRKLWFPRKKLTAS